MAPSISNRGQGRIHLGLEVQPMAVGRPLLSLHALVHKYAVFIVRLQRKAGRTVVPLAQGQRLAPAMINSQHT